MNFPDLNQELIAFVPQGIGRQQSKAGPPIVYAKLLVPDHSWFCYVAEVESNKCRDDCRIYGLFHAHNCFPTWTNSLLSDFFKHVARETGRTLEIDRFFLPGIMSYSTYQGLYLIKRNGFLPSC